MTQSEKQRVIKRLVRFKEDYNFTSKQIAEELNTTESAVSNWFNGNSLPRLEKVRNIYKLFDKYCIPGIIRFPANKHWLATFFLQVRDIKNPYASWIDNEWSGESPEIFAKWVKDWEKQFPDPMIYRQYEPGAAGQAKCNLDTLNLNTTIEHRNFFLGCGSLAEALRTHPIYCLYEYDLPLAEALARGEEDGTT